MVRLGPSQPASQCSGAHSGKGADTDRRDPVRLLPLRSRPQTSGVSTVSAYLQTEGSVADSARSLLPHLSVTLAGQGASTGYRKRMARVAWEQAGGEKRAG